MSIDHKLVDFIASAIFLYCASSLSILLVIYGIRSFCDILADDVFIVAVALAFGTMITSRNRINALSAWVHRLFKLKR